MNALGGGINQTGIAAATGSADGELCLFSGAGGQQIKRLQNVRFYRGIVQTSSGSPADALVVSTAADKGYAVMVSVAARSETDGDTMAYERGVLAENTSGVLTVVSFGTTVMNLQEDGGWGGVTIGAGGGADIKVVVTGKAGDTIDWDVVMQLHESP